MSFETEADIAASRSLAPKAGGDPVDLLEKCLHYREELGWQSTVLKELYAFISFAVAYPDAFLALVDSYNTIGSGVKNCILVSLALHDLGYKAVGIRLDSGDLAELSKQAKALFVESGDRFGVDFSHMKVVASNDINERAITELNAAGHQIDIFGIGTNLVTCQAQPALGMVYKVCVFKDVPRLKLSEEAEKTTIAGAKSAVRAFNKAGAPMFDVLCLASEYESILATPSSVCPRVYDRVKGEVAIENPFNDAAEGETSFGRVEPVTVDLYENSSCLVGELPSL